jgi:hypothetical protein
MRLLLDIAYYWNKFGFLALLKKILEKIIKLIRFREERERLLEQELIKARERYLMPVQVYSYPGQTRRVMLVTLSHDPDPDRQDTAILLALALSVARDCDLRILSAHGVNKNRFHDLLKASAIPYTRNVDFLTLDRIENGGGIDLSGDDIFICTSWLSVYKLAPSVNHRRIIYLVSADERRLPQADADRLLCLEVMNNLDINFLVMSRALYDHLVMEGLSHLRDRGAWFETATSGKSAAGSTTPQDWGRIVAQLSGFFDKVSPRVPA